MDTTQTTAALVLRVKKVCEYIFLKQLTEGNESPIGKKILQCVVMAKAGSRRQSKASHLQEKKKRRRKREERNQENPQIGNLRERILQKQISSEKLILPVYTWGSCAILFQ